MTTYPATHSGGTLAQSIEWINGVLLDSLAIGLCLIAVAVIGLMMLSGRLAIREGMRVVLGCFVLLGAPVIAAGLAGVWSGNATYEPDPAPLVQYAEPRDIPPAAEYDPYAGASLRRD